MSLLAPYIVIAAWVATAHARNETLTHGWRPEPDGRGTWSILWSCLATMFICTWSALHLPVPKRHGKWYLYFRKIRYTLLALMAPEYFFAFAAENFFKSRDAIKMLERLGNREWALTHMLFACSDGFRIGTREGRTNECELEDLLELIKAKSITDPRIPEKELQARGKSDPVVKLIAVLQIVWFVFETLFRAIQHYQVTALEIMTVAFVFCTVFTYGFCWNMPQDVEYAIIIEKRVITPAANGTAPEQSLDRSSHTEDDIGSPTPRQDHVLSELWMYNGFFFFLGLFACGFGGLHCLAWNSPFATSEERLAWRVCSVAATVLPIFLTHQMFYWYHISTSRASQIGLIASLALYALARSTIIVLAFTTLRALPADAFQTVNWNNYLPHFAA